MKTKYQYSSLGASLALLLAMPPLGGSARGAPPVAQGAKPAAAAPAAITVTLASALALANKNNRLLKAARARIGEAQGDLQQASVLLVSNPELGVTAGPRIAPGPGGAIVPDIDVSLEQRFELGGQRRHRRAQATATLRAVRATVAEVRRVVALAISRLFYESLADRERLALLGQSKGLVAEMLSAVRKRAALGAGNLLEINTVRLQLAEAQRQLLAARAAQQMRLIGLASLLGLPASAPLQLKGALPKAKSVAGGAALTRRALRLRPELRVYKHRLVAQRSALRLAKAEAAPELGIGVSYAREEGHNAVLFSLSLSLPIFNRNQGGRARALAKLRRVRAQRDSAAAAISAEVQSARVAYQLAVRALQLYTADVLAAQTDSAKLLRQSFKQGKVTFEKVLVVRRQLVAGREGYLKARLALALALARLRAAANLPQAGSQTQGGSK